MLIISIKIFIVGPRKEYNQKATNVNTQSSPIEAVVNNNSDNYDESQDSMSSTIEDFRDRSRSSSSPRLSPRLRQEWPSCGRDEECNRIFAGLERLMELSIAEYFNHPVDKLIDELIQFNGM